MRKVLNRGDIVLVPFPFTDLTSTKVRPAVVISSDSINRKSGDIIVAFISSVAPPQIETADFLITNSESDFKSTGLKTDSVFKMAKIATLSRSLMLRKIGEVSSRIRAELNERLKRALDL